MNKLRILKGEFEGEMLYKASKVKFWAIRSDFGLEASFEQESFDGEFTDMELFRALEDLVYGN